MANDPRYGEKATRILEKVEEGELAATSTFVITQVCSYLRWKRRTQVISKFLSLLRSLPSLVKVETTFQDFVHAAQICKEIGWDIWDDAVIASQMARLKISEIYSNDADFDRMPGIKRIF
ncbi:MAG: PIN domain nuclease [Candidatus Methanomethylicota archaeon]|uniref:PIN domain nuclease n=1 Tax=Thermoproteota archaeon TaxID=2056631 RepID=A0A497EQU6_9CREN|nr:MAG: PIN domain nuclease [Candidatus Verstraetearchaeota archaeon]